MCIYLYIERGSKLVVFCIFHIIASVKNKLPIFRANLSNDYFTNRQDRYFVFENCPALANFYHCLIETVSKFSFLLHKDNTIAMPQESTVHPFLVCSLSEESVFV